MQSCYRYSKHALQETGYALQDGSVWLLFDNDLEIAQEWQPPLQLHDDRVSGLELGTMLDNVT